MNIQDFVNQINELHTFVLAYIDNEDNMEDLQNLISFFDTIKIVQDRNKMKDLFYLLSAISNYHYRSVGFLDRIKKVLSFLMNDMKKSFNDFEIFNLFKFSKSILLFLFEEKIVKMNEDIIHYILQPDDSKCITYRQYFYPEIKPFLDLEKRNKIENEILLSDLNALENFERKRKSEENDSCLYNFILNDSVEEFIAYINKNIVPLTSTIKPSLFESHPYLTDKNPTLIELSAFFGSIQIFRYLQMNNVELKPSLWHYAINSNNADLIHLLEENHVQLNDNETFVKCFEESIQCHHNGIANYIQNNFLNENDIDHKLSLFAFKYYNYGFIQGEIDSDFYYNSIEYDYSSFIDALSGNSLDNIKINKYKAFQICEKNKNIEMIQKLLNGKIIDICNFQGSKIVKTINIPDFVNKISKLSFERCTSLTHLNLPSSVTSIERSSFRGCSSLVQISIPPELKFIGKFAFDGCSSLKEISIPSSVSSIEDSTFRGCSSLVKLEIPSNVKYIGKNAFDECSNLTEISIPLSIKEIKEFTFRGCKCLTKMKIPSSVEKICESAFKECSSLSEIQIDDSSSLKLIGPSAFRSCFMLKNILIPSSVDEIGFSSFEDCSSLAEVNIPLNVKVIEERTFANCSCLTKITIPQSVTAIKDSAFKDCKSLKEVTFCNSSMLKSIGTSAFRGCKSITKLTLPDSVTEMGDSAFEGCSSLKEINLFNFIKEMGERCFAGCSSLMKIAIPFSVTCLKESTFRNCSSLIEVIIPSSIKFIGERAFDGCTSLNDICFDIPSSVRSIISYAFRGCSSLKEISIPYSVTNIDKYVFKDCSSLRNISIPLTIDPKSIDIDSDIKVEYI